VWWRSIYPSAHAVVDESGDGVVDVSGGGTEDVDGGEEVLVGDGEHGWKSGDGQYAFSC